MALTLAQKAKIRAELSAKGVYWTDAQIEAHAQSLQTAEEPPPEDRYEYPKEAVGEKAGFGEQIADATLGTLWGALDVGLVGIPGAAWRSIDRDSYEYGMRELQDTAGGRVGQTLGGLAGFMVPMGWVGRGTSLAVRTARGISQAKALNAGKKITTATTRTLQRKAGDTILKTTEKHLGKSGGKGLSVGEARAIAKEVSEDAIGFGGKGFWKTVRSGGPAYKMEHSADYVNQIRTTLKTAMPEKLASELAKRNISLTGRQLGKLSDDLVNQLATKPFNSIESFIAGKVAHKIAAPALRVAGGMVQEAVNFGLVGTMMDATQLATGDLDLKETSFGKRVFHHTLLGSAFGGLKFIPGGRNQGFWKDVGTATGFTARKINKGISKMGFDEAKAFARMTMKNDKSFAISIDNVPVSLKMLRKGMGVTESQLPKLKRAMIDHNNMLTKNFRGPGWGNAIKEMRQDFLGSFWRMGAGSIAMNYAALESGEFENIAPMETAFHLALGAFLTKRGRPLFTGGEIRTGFMHFGERPYYYSGELSKINSSLRSMGIRADHIGDIAKQFDGNLYTDWMNKHPNRDVEDIIDVLGKNNVIYDKSVEGERPIDQRKEVTLMDRDLQALLTHVIPIMRSRNIEFNPNANALEMADAYNQIKRIESSQLSTDNQTMFLNSSTNIQKSIYIGASKSLEKLQSSMYDLFTMQLQQLTGTKDPIDPQGKMNMLNYDSGTLKNPDDKMALQKFEKLQDWMDVQDIIKINEISIGKGKGVPVELTAEKMKILREMQEQFEIGLGREVFGPTWNEPIDMNDPGLWNLIREVNYSKNVTHVYDLMQGREVPGVEPSESANIRSLILEVLSHKKNVDHDKIVDSPQKLGFDLTDWKGSKDELLALQRFVEHVWAISSTSKRPVDGRPVSVPIGVVQNLRDKLVKAGMPDPELHMLDGRMQDWVNKAISHGIDEATRGLDLDPYQSTVVKRLMSNGIIQVATTQTGRGTRLTAASKLTDAQVRNMIPGLNRAERKEYIDAYDRVMRKLGGKAIAFAEDFGLSELTPQQMSAIKTADHIFDVHKLKSDVDKYDEVILDKIIGFQEENRVLSESMEANPNPTEVEQIKARMDINRSIIREFDNFREAFSGAFGGGSEMSRASAYVEFVKSSVDSDGKTLLQRMDEFGEAINKNDITLISDKIKGLQIKIAEQVASRADVKTTWDELRVEEVLRRKQQEIEGFMPEDRSHTTPDKFFEKYKIKIEDVFAKSDPSANHTYDNASDVLWTLYKDTVFKGNTNHFVNKVLTLAGKSKSSASSELRDEVVHLANLFERRHTIKRVGINLDSGKGVFEKSEVSKGFLTDIYNEIFGTTDMLFLDADFMRNGKLNSIATNEGALAEIAQWLSGTDFYATLEQGSTKYEKFFRPGRRGDQTKAEGIVYEGIPISDEFIKGKHYILRVDENINLIVPEHQFNKLASSFRSWYEKVKDTDYVRKSTEKLEGAKDLFTVLKEYYDLLGDSVLDHTYDSKLFMRGSQRTNPDRYMEDAIFTMFNVMYGQKIDKDWLQDAYTNSKGQRKNYKYKRLAQNLGYTRNSQEKRNMVEEVWIDSDNKYAKELVKKYTRMDEYKVLVIDDSNVSESGLEAKNIITDNRSVAERKLKEMRDRGDIKPEAYDEMLATLRNSNSINAEAVNAMTAVRREHLDYLLLENGEQRLIGKSSGQKPVGLTSFEADGKMHVFYNKTHYFYDSKLDPFFKNNKHIEQIAFTSGAKKAKIVDSRTLENTFKPYSKIPLTSEGKSLHDWINGLEKFDLNHESLMTVKFNQTLSGTVYGGAHDVKILKQFSNWGSEKVQSDVYEWARADMAEKLADVHLQFYQSENTALASREAKSFIKAEGNRDGTISTESDNASFQSIFIEADGVPFSTFSKNLYDALIKKRHITGSGIFDGYTDAGGSPILRGNMAMDLDIPVYHDGKQIKVGEANVGSDYLDRKIHFISDFGPSVPGKPKIKGRPRYKTAGTISLIYSHEGRDIVVNLKDGGTKNGNEVVDPLNPNAKLTDYKGLNNKINNIYRQVNRKEGPIRTYRDLLKELEKSQYLTNKKRNLHLGILAIPGPRTGPHDALVLKIKNELPSADGGIMEINSYDVTMRAQRDMDTDKMYFYMDTPFSAVKESYRFGGDVLEALPPVKETIGLDPYNNESFGSYNQRQIMHRRFFGTVVKTQRKLTYAQNIFEGLLDGIKLGVGKEAPVIKFNRNKDALQRLVTDTQSAVDTYDGFPAFLKSMGDWTTRTLFGNSHSEKIEGTIGDNPFFVVEYMGKDGKPTRGAISNRAHRAIVKKILNDFGRLLNLESQVWDSGEAKQPRYEDMLSMYRDFRDEYRPERVNYNFYHYLVKAGMKAEADQIFFSQKQITAHELISKREIIPVFGELSDRISRLPSTFLKSLDTISRRDYNRVKETTSPAGDYFNKGVSSWVGKYRAEALEYFRFTGKELRGEQLSEKNSLIDNLWDAVKKERKNEKLMIQANTIEEQIRRMEWVVSEESKKSEPDQAFIDMQTENVEIKRNALSSVINKMSLDRSVPDQKFKDHTKGKTKKNIIKVGRQRIAIRDKNSGELIKMLKPGDADYTLAKGQVAVFNPVVFRPIKEHDLIDGVATAQTVLGYYSNIQENDINSFRVIVESTKKDIKKNIAELMNRSGVRDWSSHQTEALAIIQRGLGKIKELSLKEAGLADKMVDTWFGQVPQTKESYSLDFLMAMLSPNYTGNPNEYYFSPKTGGLMPAVQAPSKAVMNAVMHTLDAYNIFPGNLDRRSFIQKFAQTHRGFYDAIVAGGGFEEGMARLAFSDFQGALLYQAVDKVAHSPFMPVSEFKRLSNVIEMGAGVKSEFAELFRQMTQEGSLTDPHTAIRLRQEIINKHGEDVYESLFKVARGRVVFDGISARRFGTSGGEGQLLGHILMDNMRIRNRRIVGKRPMSKGTKIRDHLESEIGFENDKIPFNCE